MDESPLELSRIYIYPVKSLRGFSVREATLENGRFVGDREWLLVDSNGDFMHMRDYPRMARIAAANTESGLAIRMEGMPALDVERPAFDDATPVEHVPLWRRSAASRLATRAMAIPAFRHSRASPGSMPRIWRTSCTSGRRV